MTLLYPMPMASMSLPMPSPMFPPYASSYESSCPSFALCVSSCAPLNSFVQPVAPPILSYALMPSDASLLCHYPFHTTSYAPCARLLLTYHHMLFLCPCVHFYSPYAPPMPLFILLYALQPHVPSIHLLCLSEASLIPLCPRVALCHPMPSMMSSISPLLLPCLLFPLCFLIYTYRMPLPIPSILPSRLLPVTFIPIYATFYAPMSPAPSYSPMLPPMHSSMPLCSLLCPYEPQCSYSD